MRARSSRNKHTTQIFRVAVVAIVFIGVGMLIPTVIHMTGSFIMTPIHTFNQWLETSSQTFPVFVRDRNALEAEIVSLEQQLVEGQGSALTLSRLSEENKSLRSLLGAKDKKRIVAAVVARPSDLPYDVLQIDQGWEDGIKEDAAVYIGSDQFIGVVTHVAANYSFVEMLTSPGFEATTFISGPNVVANIEGYGGGIARVKVPQGIALTVGDLVHVLSIDPGVFGRISYIETTPSQPEQYGYIAPDISLHSLHFVAVDAEPMVKPSTAETYRRIDDIVRENMVLTDIDIINASSSVETATTSTNS